jgi:hypothetical protein
MAVAVNDDHNHVVAPIMEAQNFLCSTQCMVVIDEEEPHLVQV